MTAMKRIPVIIGAVALAAAMLAQSSPSTTATPVTYEYATARFMSGNRTVIVWPDGSVEYVARNAAKHPKDTDERMYWQAIVLNTLAGKGFEPIQSPMQPTLDDIVARRVKR